MLRPKISILRSFQLTLHSKRSMTGTWNKTNPFAKERIPTLPAMETITTRCRDLESLVQTHLSSQKVKFGDYEFFQCKEGYILCYINSFMTKKVPTKAFYGVFYGANHPLNNHGPVKGVQTLPHGKDSAILSAIRNFPTIEAKKLCICTDCTRTINMMRRLPEYSENGYRRKSDGKVLEIKDTFEQLTQVIRVRDDLQLRFMYTPGDILFQLREPLRLAMSASKMELE